MYIYGGHFSNLSIFLNTRSTKIIDSTYLHDNLFYSVISLFTMPGILPKGFSDHPLIFGVMYSLETSLVVEKLEQGFFLISLRGMDKGA